MKNTLTVMFIIVLSCISFIGCSNDDAADSNDGVIIPLAVGNYWKFEDAHYDEFGVVSSIDTCILSLDSSTVISEDSAYYWAWDTEDYRFFAFLAVNLDDGLYFSGSSHSGVITEYDSPMLLLKFPGSEGETFISYDISYTIVNTEALMEVPAGTFTCYEYVSSTEDNKKYFSPDSGFIMEKRYSEGVISMERRLIEYDISNAPY